MRISPVVISLAVAVALIGCATRSSSTAIAPAGPIWEGPILVSASPVSAGIDYKVVGSVSADAQVGYDSAASLYPLLASEAKKLGANAVVNAKGGRRVTAFSWSAAYVSGTAIKVDDVQMLKGMPGTYH
jgi:hypothetical protein